MTAIVAASAIIGLVAALFNSGLVSGFPPGGGDRGLAQATAVTHVMVDEPASGLSITQREALSPHVDTLVKRAEIYSRVLVTPPVLDRVATTARIPRAELSGVGRTTGDVPLALSEPNSERRASEMVANRSPYRLESQGRATAPVIDIYASAPTLEEAVRLADAGAAGLEAHLIAQAADQGVPEGELAHLRSLGPARGGVVDGRASMIVFALTFAVAFSLSAALAAALVHVRRRRLSAPSASPAELPPAGGDWPHTTRCLPWMLAGFIAMLWLVPFHQIELDATLPIDLNLDRLILPVIAALWLVMLVVGGRYAPRLRLTWIHAAMAAFLACAFLSVVLDARYLSRSLELDLSLKKLPLLVSYVSLFLMVATIVRRSELRAWMTYTLALGVICALGLVLEYRFKVNPFYEWSDRLLPGVFTMTEEFDGEALDHMGRRLVRGPAEVPLEAVTMLSIALPVAIVGLIQSARWRNRLIYAAATCVLVAAMFATFRKSALLAPVAVILTLAYFRRRELLRLAPLGLVLGALVSVLSPGALGSTIGQFTRSDALTVPTVSDRSSDYDAVRPDVWSHLAFGRGWGSYNHVDYRILDSEILHRVIEMGVVGLLAYLLVPICVVLCTRKLIAARGERSAIGLMVSAGSVAFLVGSVLYDVMSFPHAAYIFLYTAGLAAVLVAPERPAAVHARRRAVHHGAPVLRRRPARPPREHAGV